MATTSKPGTPRGMQPPDNKPVRITVPNERKERYGDPFFPKVFFQSVFYISAILAMLIFLALASPAPLQDPADPLNHAAIDPRPEWYFMFLFQLLKYFPGQFIILGTAIIPAIVVLLLLLLPFYDRNWARKINRRPVAAASMTGGMLIVMFLTWGGFGFPTPSFTTTSEVAVPTAVPGQPTPSISPEVEAIFQAHCAACHISQSLGGLSLKTYDDLIKGGTEIPGPVIAPGNHKASILWQKVQPKAPWPPVPGGTRMPLGGPYLSDADISTIANWIDSLGKPVSSGTATTGGTAAPVSYKNDIQPIFNAHCATCHISTVSGGLSLATYSSLMKGATSGPVVTAGNHSTSPLWQVLQPGTGQPGGQRMPLGGPYLADPQIKKIADWIDQGAKDN